MAGEKRDHYYDLDSEVLVSLYYNQDVWKEYIQLHLSPLICALFTNRYKVESIHKFIWQSTQCKDWKNFMPLFSQLCYKKFYALSQGIEWLILGLLQFISFVYSQMKKKAILLVWWAESPWSADADCQRVTSHVTWGLLPQGRESLGEIFRQGSMQGFSVVFLHVPFVFAALTSFFFSFLFWKKLTSICYTSCTTKSFNL